MDANYEQLIIELLNVCFVQLVTTSPCHMYFYRNEIKSKMN